MVPLAAVAVYSGALRGDFVWDDWFLVVENPRIQSLGHLASLFTEDYVFVPETNFAYGYYRPLASLSFVADYHFWGLDPFGFHLTNVLLHATASLLAVLLAARLGLGAAAASACGLLFAVHPIHTENVAWIAGRTDLLAFVLGAASLLAHLLAGERRRSRTVRRALGATSVALFALALLAKEMAAVVPLWIGCWALADLAAKTAGGRFRRALRAAVPHLVVLALYLLVRFVALDLPAPGQLSEHSAASALATAAPTVVRYIARMAVPTDLSAYLQNPYVDGWLAPRALGAIAALALLGFGVLRLGRVRPLALPLGAMLAVSFAPLLNIPRIAGPADMGAPMADRFAYFPTFPFLALALLAVEAGVATSRDPRRLGRLAAVATLALAALFAAATRERTRAWRNDPTLFAAETARTPGAPLLWTNLARARLRLGDLAGAGEALDRAEALAPAAGEVLAARAQWLVMRAEPERALPLQLRVVGDADRASAAARNNLAFLYRVTGRPERALPILETLTRELPDYADPHLNLGELFRATGEPEAATRALTTYVELRPADLRGVEGLARSLAEQARFDEAEAVYLDALRRSPGDARLWNNLGLLRFEAGDLIAALAALDRALAEDPASRRARLNSAIVLVRLGRAGEARPRLEELARSSPESEEGRAAQGELDRLAGGAESAAAPDEKPMRENQAP